MQVGIQCPVEEGAAGSLEPLDQQSLRAICVKLLPAFRPPQRLPLRAAEIGAPAQDAGAFVHLWQLPEPLQAIDKAAPGRRVRAVTQQARGRRDRLSRDEAR